MIILTQFDQVGDDAHIVIASPSGVYAETDVVLCALRDTPTIPLYAYQAQYVKYGGLVYRFNTPEELGAAILQRDPESSHTAALLYKEEQARINARALGVLKPEVQSDVEAMTESQSTAPTGTAESPQGESTTSTPSTSDTPAEEAPPAPPPPNPNVNTETNEPQTVPDTPHTETPPETTGTIPPAPEPDSAPTNDADAGTTDEPPPLTLNYKPRYRA